MSSWVFLLRVRWDQTGDVGTKITQELDDFLTVALQPCESTRPKITRISVWAWMRGFPARGLLSCNLCHQSVLSASLCRAVGSQSSVSSFWWGLDMTENSWGDLNHSEQSGAQGFKCWPVMTFQCDHYFSLLGFFFFCCMASWVSGKYLRVRAYIHEQKGGD